MLPLPSLRVSWLVRNEIVAVPFCAPTLRRPLRSQTQERRPRSSQRRGRDSSVPPCWALWSSRYPFTTRISRACSSRSQAVAKIRATTRSNRQRTSEQEPPLGCVLDTISIRHRARTGPLEMRGHLRRRALWCSRSAHRGRSTLSEQRCIRQGRVAGIERRPPALYRSGAAGATCVVGAYIYSILLRTR